MPLENVLTSSLRLVGDFCHGFGWDVFSSSVLRVKEAMSKYFSPLHDPLY